MNKIERTKYTGYIWRSDKTSPEIYVEQEFELELNENENPYIIEGHLYDGNNSYSIKYVDGKYIVVRYELNKLKSLEMSISEYLPSFKGVEKLVFHQYWRPIVDELCCGMEVLKPAEFVFVGFKNKED